MTQERRNHGPAAYAAILMAVSAAPIRAQDTDVGGQLYQRCAVCHLPTAKGVPGAFPSLVERLGPLAGEESGREYLVMVVHAGLSGPLDIDGVLFRGVMPGQGAALSDLQMAKLLNFILERFNTSTLAAAWRRYTAEEIAAVRRKHSERTIENMTAMRRKAFATAADGTHDD